MKRPDRFDRRDWPDDGSSDKKFAATALAIGCGALILNVSLVLALAAGIALIIKAVLL